MTTDHKPASDEEIAFHFHSPGGAFCQSPCEDNPDCHGWGCELVSRLIARIAADAETIKAQAKEIEKREARIEYFHDLSEDLGASAKTGFRILKERCGQLNRVSAEFAQARETIKTQAEEIERLRAFIGEARRDGGWGQIRFDQATAILAASEGKE